MSREIPAARAWLAVFVMAVFGAGVATGMLLDRALAPSMPPPPGVVLFRDGAAPMRLMTLMADELDLTAEQQRELEEIIEARRRKLGAFRKHLRVQFRREAEEVGAEIEHLLTPDQRERFDLFVSRLRSRDLAPEASTAAGDR